MRLPALATLAVLAACHAPSPRRPDLTTTAERTEWRRTGRYDEAVRLCGDFAVAYPGRARCDTFGVTSELRPLVALVVGADLDRPRPTILVEAGIHAGEIEGKDAGFQLLREVLDGALPGVLDAVTIVFVPVINPDGHERFGPNNRPNQRGPEEMGFRVNAQNLNLNRDFIKLDTPELAALLGLWKRWDPVVFVDLHTTDGAKFQHDVAVMVAPREAGKPLSDALKARLTALGHLPLDIYPAFNVADDPMSGIDVGDAPPRFSNIYASVRGRIGILVETHSWRTYAERAHATHDTLQALLERAVTDAPAWRDAADAADAAGAALAGQEVVLLRTATGEPHTLDFLGYAYTRTPSDVSGVPWTRYDETKPEVWKIPVRDQLAPAITVTAPRGGYLVGAGFADEVARRLELHDVRYERLDAEVTVDAEVFRATKVDFAPPYEGRTRATLEGAWTPERRTIAPGALWVPIAQPRGLLVLELLEPSAPDSLASWGFFNAVFEQKEYMESYVAEEVARAMLADPTVKAAFDAALADPAFAASPERRLDFFYRRHPSWDERKDLLPVVRVAARP